jgi:aryl-alcohol dehydrogenase-like predicted oxidoreductase
MEAYEMRNAQGERTWTIIDAVGNIAKARGVSLGQVAPVWVAAQPAVTSVILGARSPEQLADNLAAASLSLSADEIATLSAVNAPPIGDYPYGKGGTEQRHRKTEGGR